MLIGSLYGTQSKVLRDALANRQDVRTSGAMKALVRRNPKIVPDMGELDMDERQRLMADVGEHGVTYVVWSYVTPIAWVKGDGEVYLVPQRFSRTTSRHQSVAACYL